MNLLEALEKKRALTTVIDDLEDSFSININNLEKLTEILTDVDKFVDELFHMERLITRHYQETMVTSEESVADALTHVDALNRKIEALKYLLLEVTREEILTGNKSTLSKRVILTSIIHYETIKDNLVTKVKEICYNTPFIDDKSKDVILR